MPKWVVVSRPKPSEPFTPKPFYDDPREAAQALLAAQDRAPAGVDIVLVEIPDPDADGIVAAAIVDPGKLGGSR